MSDIKCPYCGSNQVIKKGKRKTSSGDIQVYRCRGCGRRFVDTPLRYTKYHPRVIYHALNCYNLGYTSEETSRLVNRRFRVNIGKSTVSSWVKKYRDLCPITVFRERFRSFDEVVVCRRFEHENLDYEFMYHRYKLGVYARKRFPGLAMYIQRFEQGCPDEFFEVGERCSKPLFKVEIYARKRVNLACRMAGFAVLARRSNRERHSLVERFMLINDTATVACEVPVWYWEKSVDSGVTGHIDLIQVRGDNVVILDYKPDASRDRKAAQQLYHYAVALSFRTGVSFERIRCGWFDESMYYEYSPAVSKAKLIR